MSRAILFVLIFLSSLIHADLCSLFSNNDVHIQTSALIWQAKEGGLEFVSLSFLPNGDSFREKVSTPDFAWKPGLQLEVGVPVPFDGWDTSICYTFYHGALTSLKKHFNSQIAPPGIGIIPLWHYPFIDLSPSSLTPLRFGSAAANWKLFLNALDFSLGRTFISLPSLPIRTYLGAKLTWTRQFYHVDYGNGTTVLGILTAPPAISLQYLNSRMRFQSNACGIGPRGGFSSKWECLYGVSLIADAAFSLLYTFNGITTKYDDQILSLGQVQTYLMQIREKEQELIPILEGSLGFDWKTSFCSCRRRFYVGATIAYEVQYWWSQNHVRRNYSLTAPGNQWEMRGDLQLQGLNASLYFDY